MSDSPMPTKPLSSETKFLREKYYAAKTSQSELMDQLARDLIKLELAITGIYTAVLKLVEGADAVMPEPLMIYWVFGFWGTSLLLTLISLFPRQWMVDTSKVKPGPNGEGEILSLEGFFQKSAAYKRSLLMGSAVIFFVGLFMATWMILRR